MLTVAVIPRDCHIPPLRCCSCSYKDMWVKVREPLALLPGTNAVLLNSVGDEASAGKTGWHTWWQTQWQTRWQTWWETECQRWWKTGWQRLFSSHKLPKTLLVTTLLFPGHYIALWVEVWDISLLFDEWRMCYAIRLWTAENYNMILALKGQCKWGYNVMTVQKM